MDATGSSPHHRFFYDVFVDSTTAVNGVVRIPLDPGLDDVRDVVLLEAEVPITFQMFRSGVLTFSESTFGTVSDPFVAKIPDGNYMSSTMAAAIQSAMNASGCSGFYTCTVDSVSGSFTITRTDGVDATHRIVGLGYTSAYKYNMLGLEPSDTPSRTVVFVPQISGPNALALRSNLASFMDSAHVITNYEQTNSSIVARIQQTSDVGSVLFYVENVPVPRKLSCYGKLRFLEFSLTFVADETPLLLHGGVWSARLRIGTGR